MYSRSLIALAEPHFRLPHHSHFVEKVIPAKYLAVQRVQLLRKYLQLNTAPLTTDLWTAQYQQRSYISLTAHFVNSKFQLHSRCPQTREVPEDHDAQSLQEVLSKMLLDWNIDNKVLGATTDNGHNIVNAIGLLGLKHFPCFAHTLQPSINNGSKIVRVRNALARCKKIVKHFKKSTKKKCKLRQKQDMPQIPQHKPVQDCVTRWGSTLGMMERLIEQQAAIATVLVEGKTRYLMLDVAK